MTPRDRRWSISIVLLAVAVVIGGCDPSRSSESLRGTSPADPPTAIEPGRPRRIIEEGDSMFLADRFVVETSKDADYADVVAAADSVDGAVVGLVMAGWWQIAIPAVGSRAELDRVIEKISRHPVAVYAEPESIAVPENE
jgi:hypothetical protein